MIVALLAIGLVCCGAGALRRRSWQRTARVAELLDLPGTSPVDVRAVSPVRLGRVVEVLGLAAPDPSSRTTAAGAPATNDVDRAIAAAALGAVGLAVGALVTVLTGQVAFGAIAMCAAVTGCVLAQRRRVQVRRRRIEEQIPEALVVIAASLEAGNPLARALQLLARTGAQPLADEIAIVVAEVDLGTPVADAVDRMAERVDVADLAWFARALRIQQSVGGQLAPLVRTVADVMTARAELQREARVLTAEGRLSAWILGALPVLLAFACQAMNPGYLAPLLRGTGLFVLAGCALSIIVGIAWVLRMVNLGDQR